MTRHKKRKISITGPENLSGLRLEQPKDFAAGLPAVKVALDHALKEMGIKKSLSSLSKMNQKGGFDCPGCAWPDPEKRSSLGEFCENGVKAMAEEGTGKKVDAHFFAQYSVPEISHWTDFDIGKSGRLTEPMILKEHSDHYEPISWNEAFKHISDELNALNNPNEAIFYTSGRSSNEAAFLYGTFARAFGTNNLPDCSNMCHESSGAALSESLGIGKGSVTLEDFDKAEIVMVIGQNPGTNHPRMLSSLENCKRNGGKIIAVNPLEEAGLIRFKNPQKINGMIGKGTPLTDIHLQVKINQDVSLIKLIIKKLKHRDLDQENVFDHHFIRTHTTGYASLMEDIDRYDENELLALCGIDENKIDQVVELLSGKKKIIICWAMGLTQHKNAVDNIKECVNLLLLKGSIGIEGGGTCPVRGHSNVQGDRTVGIMHYVSPQLNKSLKRVFDFDPPEQEGYDVVHAIKAMYDKKARVFMALGGNFLSAASDTLYTGEALQNCNLTVHISTKLNRSHVVPGKVSIILPTFGRSELDSSKGKHRFLTVENSMGIVHRTQGRLVPASEKLLSEPEIVAGIASATLKDKFNINWEKLGHDYHLIREKISQVFSGFDDYSNRSQGAGFYLPNNSRKGDFSRLPDGKAKFSICQLPKHELKKSEFLLMTIRSHDQFNTTIYGMDDRYRGIYNERRVIFINKSDALSLGLAEKSLVNLVSNYRGIRRTAKNFVLIYFNIPRGNLGAYFPETNVLVPHDEFADISGTPISKSVKVSIHKTNTPD